jgi:hypothetical protein
LRAASVFRIDGRRAEVIATRYRYLLEAGAEAIEPALDVDEGDSSVAAPWHIFPRFITSSQPL